MFGLNKMQFYSDMLMSVVVYTFYPSTANVIYTQNILS